MARKTDSTAIPKLPRGEGTITRQANGLLVGQLYVGPPGARVRRSVTGTTAAEVVKKLKQLRDDDGKVDLSRTRDTLSSLLDAWFATLRERGQGGTYSPNTLRGYRGIINTHLKKEGFGTLTLDQLGGRDGPALVATFLDELTDVSDQTRRNIRMCLGTCLSWAFNQNRILANPVLKVKAPPPSKFRGKILDQTQARNLREAFRGHPLEAALVITLNYGLRRAEALGLQWQHIHLDDPIPYAHIELTMHQLTGRGRKLLPTKNEHSRRNIPLNPELVQLFRERQRIQAEQEQAWSGDRWNNADDLVFTAAEGHGVGVSVHEFSKLVVAMFVAVGIREPGEKGFRLHDLRHNAISGLLLKNTPVSIAQEIAGHKSLATTSRYTHVNLEHMARVAALFD